MLLPGPSLILRVASIQSEQFTARDIESALPNTYKEVKRNLNSILSDLCENRFLSMSGAQDGLRQTYSFDSAILRSVCSDMMLKRHKADARLENIFAKIRIGRAVSRAAEKLKAKVAFRRASKVLKTANSAPHSLFQRAITMPNGARTFSETKAAKQPNNRPSIL